MILICFLAVALPGLYWDQGAATADAVKQAGIERIYVPAGQESAWSSQGLRALVFDATKFVKLPAPGVEYRMNVAAATSLPWVDANGWRFARDPRHAYYYDVPWRKAALAAAEAHAYGVEAVVHPDPRDLAEFGRMLAFLRSLDGPRLAPLANIGIIDDGSEETGEVLNLMARRNLLFEAMQAPDPRYDLNVRIGSSEYPKEEAADPYTFASLLRRKLTDEKRWLRIFGSDVVLARLTGDGGHVRVHLVNYGGGKVEGLRVRVRGEYRHSAIAAFGVTHAAAADYSAAGGATEFTIPTMNEYAVVDLSN